MKVTAADFTQRVTTNFVVCIQGSI